MIIKRPLATPLPQYPSGSLAHPTREHQPQLLAHAQALPAHANHQKAEKAAYSTYALKNQDLKVQFGRDFLDYSHKAFQAHFALP